MEVIENNTKETMKETIQTKDIKLKNQKIKKDQKQNILKYDRHRAELILDCIDQISEKLQLIKDAASKIRFEEDEHKYFVDGQEFPSVTTLLKEFNPFDEQLIATRSFRRYYDNQNSKYYRKTVDDILNMWESSRNEAAEKGTDVHEFAESCFSFITGNFGDIYEKDRGKVFMIEEFGDDINDENQHQGSNQHQNSNQLQGLKQIQDIYKVQNLESLCMTSNNPKELAVIKYFNSILYDRVVPVMKETKVYNDEVGYCGTFDLLLYDKNSESFLIRDWKTNKDLFKSFGCLLSPFDFLDDSAISTYYLQQNLYALCLKNLGLPVTGHALVWLKPNGENQVCALKLNPDEVGDLLAKHRK